LNKFYLFIFLFFVLYACFHKPVSGGEDMIIQSIIGLAVFILAAAALSENRKKISFPFILIALGLQLIIGFVFLKLQMIRQVFLYLNKLVLVSLVSLANMILGVFPEISGKAVTLQRILGWVMAPVSWLMGIPWAESITTGSLMGTKTVINEFIAFLDLANLPDTALSERSRVIISYAMCGFANPGSLGIMIGGMGAMAPQRRDEIVSLGFRSIIAGTIATCMTGAVAGLFL
jgi:nucleoside permease NupC